MMNTVRLCDRAKRPLAWSNWRALLVVSALVALAACSDDEADRANANDGGLGASGGSAGHAGAKAPRTDGGTGGSSSHAGAGASGGSSNSQSVTGDRRVPYTPANDRAFVDFFVTHHQMAIMMAEHELEHGDNADVKNVAQNVVDSQQPEVETMMAIAAELTQPASAAMPSDPHAEADMDHMSKVTGAELDGMFLTEMIAHHAAGLPVAHRALKVLTREDLRTLATDMQTMQGKEIGQMQTLRAKLKVSGAGVDLASGEEDRADMGIVGDMRISLTPTNDVEFIDFFVPHHQMAIEMAEVVIMRGEDSGVRMMAQEMRDAQSMEVERMRSARASAAGSADSPAPPKDMHMESDMSMMMNLSGKAVDAMFLGEMVQHHAAGIPTAHRAKPHVQNADLEAMADSIFETQAREVGEMEQMLEKLGMP